MNRSWKGLLAGLCVVALAGWAAVAAQDKKEPAKGAADDALGIAAKLVGRVTVENAQDMSLKDALEFLSDKSELTILIDYAAFARHPGTVPGMEACQDPAGIADRMVKLPKVRNVRLGTVLRTVLSQLDGAYLVYPDHIKVTTVQQMALETGQKPYTPESPESPEDPGDDPYKVVRATPLIHVAPKEQPLRDVLREIADATGATVVLAPQAGEKGQAPITAKMVNTPLPDGVRVLAEMAGLKAVSAGNAILVTTPTHAAEWQKEDAARKPPQTNWGVMPGGIGLCANGNVFPIVGQPVDAAQFVELQKKVADLEKKLAEAQQPKK